MYGGISVTDTCPRCGREATLSTKNIFICKYCDIELDIYIGNCSICAINWSQRMKYTRLNTKWKITFLEDKNDT